MRKILVIATLFLVALSVQAQEKVMNIQKTDGTTSQTRVAELKQISFLTVEEGGQGLMVKTLDGEWAGVLFETNPVVTVSSGKLIVKSSAANPVEIVISDIAEILFCDVAEATPVSELESQSFDFVVQDGGALLRDIPKGVKPRIYSLDGRSIPTPHFNGGELRLSRDMLGSGIFIVKVGTFSAKIKF